MGSSALGQLITVKLDWPNYSHGSYLMRNFLKKKKGLLKHVRDDKICLTKGTTDYEAKFN